MAVWADRELLSWCSQGIAGQWRAGWRVAVVESEQAAIWTGEKVRSKEPNLQTHEIDISNQTKVMG